MFAAFQIFTGAGERAPGVPKEAVIWDGDTSVVWLQLDGWEFQRRRVKLGRQSEVMVQIKDGLSAGDVIITRGAIFVDTEWKQ